MNHATRLLVQSFAGLAICTACSNSDTISVTDAWIAEAPPGATTLAGYMIIENSGNKARSIVSASSDSFTDIEVHRTVIEKGTARMVQQVEIALPARETIVLEPGGSHLMLVRPERSIAVGDSITIRLHFYGGESIQVDFIVRSGRMQ